MDKGQYTYSTLWKKYDQFTAPAFEITVGSTKLDCNQYTIPSLDVEICADGNAGGCSFTVDGLYDYETETWSNKLASLIQVGDKLIVKGGYVQKKELFYGYVDDYTVEFQKDRAPRVSVTGIDALGYLMSLREPLYAGQKKAAEIVKTILNKGVSAGFAKSVTVGTLTGFETPIVKEQVDDWRFLNLMAQRYGASLFVVDGELIFDTVADQTSPIITLQLGRELQSFTKRVSIAHQVGKVEIYGRDVNQKAVKGTASSVSTGSGKSAADLVPKLKQAVLREYSEYAQTQAECKKLAQNRLNGIAMGLVFAQGQCVGIPELIPGRYLKVEGTDDQLDGTYFLTKIRHSFVNDGYVTSFEAKGAKI